MITESERTKFQSSQGSTEQQQEQEGGVLTRRTRVRAVPVSGPHKCDRQAAQKIKSPSDILDHEVGKYWYFNRELNHEVADEYQLLSLGNPHVPEEVVPNLWQLNDLGNGLRADLQYQELFSAVFKELHWDDTDEQGVGKAIAIRDKNFPNVNDRVIPWIGQFIEENYGHMHKQSICSFVLSTLGPGCGGKGGFF